MTDDNPFGEIGDEISDDVVRQLELAEEVDGMEEDATPWECEFLDTILKQLRGGTPLTDGQYRILKLMHEKYGFS